MKCDYQIKGKLFNKIIYLCSRYDYASVPILKGCSEEFKCFTNIKIQRKEKLSKLENESRG